MNKRKISILVLLLSSVFLVSACSNSVVLKNGIHATKSPSKTPGKTIKQTPKVLPAPVPGSIKSVYQKNLSDGCKTNIDKARKIMANYQSGFAVSPKVTRQIIKINMQSLVICSKTEYTSWYNNEFRGWFYAKNTK